MKAKAVLTVGLLVISLVNSTFAGIADKPYIIDMLTNPSGEKIRGPRKVKIIRINKIKQEVSIGTQTSSLSGISLDLPFIPATPKGAPPEEQVENLASTRNKAEALTNARNIINGKLYPAKPPTDAKDQFQAVQDSLKNIEETLIPQNKNLIDDALATAKEAIDSIESLVRESDSLIRGSQTELNRHLDEVTAKIGAVLGKSWPDNTINEVLGLLAASKTRLRDISDETWLAKNKGRYDATLAQIDQLLKDVQSLQRNDDRTKFDEAQQKLQHWRVIFSDARAQGENYFTQEVEARCESTFSDGKETKVKVTRKNRLNKNAEAETLEVVTVACSPPLSISAGFGFSAIDERDITFIQSNKTTIDAMGKPTQTLVNRFGYKGNSSFRTLPVILLNTRLYEPNDTMSLHASVGAAVDFKGQLGTDAEFIVGPSLAFKRTLFITPGLHIGRVPKLTGGFQSGDEVPSGVDAPPIEKAWKPGFAVTFTFKIR